MLVLAVLLAAAACSSTRRVDEVVAGGDAADGATDETVAGVVEGGTGDAPGSAAGAGPKAANAAGGGGPSAGAGGPGTSSSPGSTKGGAGGGGTAPMSGGTIELGIPYLDAAKAGTFLDAIGFAGTGGDLGNPQHQAQLVVDHVNANGGMSGRKVVPVYYEMQVDQFVTQEGRVAMAQSMCSTFTEDHHVFAFLLTNTMDASILDCAAAKKTPVIANGPSLYIDQQHFASVSDYYYSPSSFIADRRERVYVDSLVAQGFLKPGNKIGLLIPDQPDLRRAVEKSLKPALADHGLKVESEAVYPEFVQSPWSNYVLQFQTKDVDRVLFSLTGGAVVVPVLFMRAADNQQYRPLYGLGSDVSLNETAAAAPAGQLHGARALGWLPYEDLPEGAAAPTAANATCRQIMAKGGEPETAPAGWEYCDGLFLLKAALDRTTTITPAGLSAAVAGLKRSWTSVVTYGSLFGPGRHDGAHVVHDAAFDDGCNCFKYTTGPRSLP